MAAGQGVRATSLAQRDREMQAIFGLKGRFCQPRSQTWVADAASPMRP
jgi:hypothetical protein